MRNIRGTFTLVVCLACVVATSEELPLGTWEGQFTSGPWAGQRLVAQVSPQGEDVFRAVLSAPSETGPWPRAELTGLRRGAAAMFIGGVNLDKAPGGAVTITAELVGPRITGHVYSGDTVCEFALDKTDVKPPTLGAKPPEGAVVLFDGTDLDSWSLMPGNLVDGTLQIGSSSFVTKQEFGDCKIHLEFQTPLMASARGQGRGNSGVYLQGRYEIQVLDSFGDEPASDLCGGIYKVATPLVNACLPPMTWQTYDITFRAPRFDSSGQKTKDAEVTVLHNGALIHDKVSIPGPTGGAITTKESGTGPLFLQDHGNRVRYRNIWVVPDGK